MGKSERILAALRGEFPALGEEVKVTSPKDPHYNCIAWAADDEKRWWWPFPDPAAFWPEGAPRQPTPEAFLVAFQIVGYAACNDGTYEEGFEKVAFYARSGEIKHAARQLRDGRWTSKMGSQHDIEHDLEDLSGGVYGKVVQFMRRPL